MITVLISLYKKYCLNISKLNNFSKSNFFFYQDNEQKSCYSISNRVENFINFCSKLF